MENSTLLPEEITGEMLLNQHVTEIPTLLEPLLPQSGLVCLAGSSDTGKSAFLRQLAMSVCAGLKSFLGMKLNVRYHSAIYVSTEDDETANVLKTNVAQTSFKRHSGSGEMFAREAATCSARDSANRQSRPRLA